MVDRQGEGLQSTFVSVYEIHHPDVAPMKVTRLPLRDNQDTHVALQIQRNDGEYDILILRDPESPGHSDVTLPDGSVIESDGDVSLLRIDPAGTVRFAGLASGTKLTFGGFTLENPSHKPFVTKLTP